MNADPHRAKDLARIHLAAKQLGLDDPSYRDILRSTTGKTSAGELGPRQRFKVLQALLTLGAEVAAPRSYPGKPARAPQGGQQLLEKVEALLTDAKRPWAYAQGMARRMFQHELAECEPDELRRIVAALTYDAKRREAKVTAPSPQS